MKTNFDLIIVGGGITGLTLANLVANHGLDVAIIEQYLVPTDYDATIYDLRTFALSLASKKVFEDINIWSELLPKIKAYDRIEVWESNGFGHIEFNADEIGHRQLGYIIEQQFLLNLLWQEALKKDNIFIFNDIPKEICYTTKNIDNEVNSNDDNNVNNIILELESGKNINSQLLVGAEGKNSWVRQKANIFTEENSYQQKALCCILETEYSHQNTAWQRFLPEGPIAFLPLANSNVSSLIWTNTNENTESMLKLTKEDLAEKIASAFDFQLGKIKILTEVKSFPLSKMHAKHYFGKRIALIGDACHVIHPMAGQGLNLGLADVSYLGDIIIHAYKRECDIGHPLLLKKYEKMRKIKVTQMMKGLDFLKFWFEQKNTIFGIRSLLVNFANRNSFIKKMFMREAIGL